MKFRLYIHSNEHPRTINSYANSRTYFTCFECNSEAEAINKYLELKAQGIIPYEIRTPLGTRCFVCRNEDETLYIHKAKPVKAACFR